MFLGALLDLGLPLRELEQDLAGLGVRHALRVSRVKRGALAARYVSVEVPGAGRSRKPRATRKRASAHAPQHAAPAEPAQGGDPREAVTNPGDETR